jgi:hypothetical protein
MAGRWANVGEAAQELGISTDALRKRIARGTVESRRQDGAVLVWLDDGGTEAGREAQVDSEVLVESLQDQVHYLRSVLTEERDARRRADTIIAQLTQANAALSARVPELPPAASHEPSQPPVAATEGAETREPRPSTGEPMAEGSTEERREPWWRRIFGG